MLINICFVNLYALCVLVDIFCLKMLSGKLKVKIWIIHTGLVHLARELDQAACLMIRISLQTVIVLINRLHVYRKLTAPLNQELDHLVHLHMT